MDAVLIWEREASRLPPDLRHSLPVVSPLLSLPYGLKSTLCADLHAGPPIYHIYHIFAHEVIAHDHHRRTHPR